MNKKYKLKLNCFCESKNSKLLFYYKKKPNKETDFKIKKKEYFRKYKICKICKHVYGEHNINLKNLYNSEYLNSTYNDIEGMKKRFLYVMNLPYKKSDNKQRVKRILNFLKIHSQFKVKNLLDVGAGTGVFAKSFINKKWDVQAIETDKRMVQYLNDLGIKSTYADITKYKNNKKYNLITFNKVLEHVEKPYELLFAIKKFMTKKSILYLEVPDMIAYKKGKQREEFYIDHHHVFSISSASILIEKLGFKIIKIERIIEPSGKYTIYLFASL